MVAPRLSRPLELCRCLCPLVVLAVLFGGGCKDRCRELEPQFEVALLLPASIDPGRVARLRVQVAIGQAHREITYSSSADLSKLLDRQTSIRVVLGDRVAGPAAATITVTAENETGQVLGAEHASYVLEPDGCNFFSMTLVARSTTDQGTGEHISPDAGAGKSMVSTLAGSVEGYQNGEAASAQFKQPWGIAVDSAGTIYVGEYGNNRVRKLWQDIGGLQVGTLAGSGAEGAQDGPGLTASFGIINGLGLASAGQALHVADMHGHKIRSIDLPGAMVGTLAGSLSSQNGYQDGPSSLARFDHPRSTAAGSDGRVYVADQGNNRVRVIDTRKDSSAADYVTTLAGSGVAGFKDGPVATSQLNGPHGVAVDSAGRVYVADTDNHRIRVIFQGEIRTVAGTGVAGHSDGSAFSAKFNGPVGLTVDPSGVLYVADTLNHRIRRIDLARKPDSPDFVTTVAGSGAPGCADGTGAAATFNHPKGVAVTGSGGLLVADFDCHKVRLIQHAQ